MTARKRLLGELMGRLTKVSMSGPEPNAAILAELTALRDRVPRLTGSLVASSDGLLVAHDLPDHIEPSGMAALAAAQLSLSYRLATTAHGGGFHEVVVHGSDDPIVPVELSRDFCRLARRAGDDTTLVELAGVEHFAVIDPFSAAWPAVLAAFGTVTRGEAEADD